MADLHLRREGKVFVLEMRDGENRLDAAFLQGFNAALDEVERETGPAALVTAAEGKYWSTGIDLDWLAQQPPDEASRFRRGLEQLLRRILLFPMATVAALNGHTFAGGGLIAMAHDYRIMRSDRGWLCFPEVDIRIPFTEAMVDLLRERLSPQVYRDAILTGTRYGGETAYRHGLVDGHAAEDALLQQAVAKAAALADKGRDIVGKLKATMYRQTAAALAGAEAADLTSTRSHP